MTATYMCRRHQVEFASCQGKNPQLHDNHTGHPSARSTAYIRIRVKFGLAKDFEGTLASATAFLYAASVMLLTRDWLVRNEIRVRTHSR